VGHFLSLGALQHLCEENESKGVPRMVIHELGPNKPAIAAGMLCCCPNLGGFNIGHEAVCAPSH